MLGAYIMRSFGLRTPQLVLDRLSIVIDSFPVYCCQPKIPFQRGSFILARYFIEWQLWILRWIVVAIIDAAFFVTSWFFVWHLILEIKHYSTKRQIIYLFSFCHLAGSSYIYTYIFNKSIIPSLIYNFFALCLL